MKKIISLLILQLLMLGNVNAQIVDARKGDNDMWGFVDGSGRWVVAPQYHSAKWYQKEKVGEFEGRRSVSSNESYTIQGLVNEYGKIVVTPDRYYFYAIDDVKDPPFYIHVTTYKDRKKGIVRDDGTWIIPCKFEGVSTYDSKDGVFFGVTDFSGKTGIINSVGKQIVPCQYSENNVYFAGYNCIVMQDAEGRKGVFSTKGKLIVPFRYKDITVSDYKLREPCIEVTDYDEKHGVYSLSGELIVPCKYLLTQTYVGGVSVKDTNGKFGVYGYDGRKILDIIYGNMLILDEDTTYGRYNLINLGGTPTSDNHRPQGGKWGMYDNITGQIVVPCEYDVVNTTGGNMFSINQGGKMWESDSGGKWGLYGDGRELLPCEYDEPIRFVNDVATVKKDGEVKMIKNPLKDGSQIMIAEGGSGVNNKKKVGGPAVSRYPAPDSDVDRDIPVAKGKAENTFAFIIANENYPDAPVPYSLNDGRMFKEYCQKTLGLPEKNINLYEDATFGNIITAVEKMKQVADAYDGDASVIFYYAGHGFPDDKQQTAYLLPIDGDASSITTTGYSLAKLYKEIAGLKMKSAVVFLDACFSGAKREDQMLASSRGVAIKVKEEAPQGKMLVFSAAQGDETAHQLEDKHHGLFTYYLLKELQTAGGDVDMGTLTEYVTKQVKRQSVVINNKKQTPTVIPSQALQAGWQTMRLR